MREAVVLSGVVLYAQSVFEYDKRVVILTRERGKITAFAHGARRPTSALLAPTNPFVFAKFTLYEGKNAYSLVQVESAEYFSELASMQPGVYYGFYFLEAASYFAQENLEAEGMVNLIYVGIHAILKGKVPLKLLRAVFECRLLTENGLFALPEDAAKLNPSAVYALRFASGAPFRKLFSFTLSEDAQRDFIKVVHKRMRSCVDVPLKSLELIDELS